MTLINPSCLTCKTRGCSLLNHCSNDVLKEITDRKIFRKIKKGESVISEGKEAIHIAFVKSGILKVERNGKNNRPLILRLAKEGDILGHRFIGHNDSYPVSAVAVENAQVCLLPAYQFQSLMERCTDFRREIIKAYLQEMKDTESKTLYLVHKTVKEKLACILLHISEIYKYKTQPNGIHIHLSRQEMADLSGTTKEQVSKVLADFKKEKLIHFRAKHFKFFDLQKLEQIAADCPAS